MNRHESKPDPFLKIVNHKHTESAYEKLAESSFPPLPQLVETLKKGRQINHTEPDPHLDIPLIQQIVQLLTAEANCRDTFQESDAFKRRMNIIRAKFEIVIAQINELADPNAPDSDEVKDLFRTKSVLITLMSDNLTQEALYYKELQDMFEQKRPLAEWAEKIEA